jgi:DNA-binding NarL/FixJ family response regulator
MKKINVTCICAEAEEYPGCADLLFSYSEVNVIALPTSLVGAATAQALVRSDVLLVDESVMYRDGLQPVRSIHTRFPHLRILLVYRNKRNNNTLEYLSIGIRGLIEHKSRISQLRRAIPALYAGELWMPRGLVQSLRNQSKNNDGSSSWEFLPPAMPDRGKIN